MPANRNTESKQSSTARNFKELKKGHQHLNGSAYTDFNSRGLKRGHSAAVTETISDFGSGVLRE